jgi:uncharacterized membrane protein
MNDLLVLTYDNTMSAKGAREAVRPLQHQGLLTLEDAAVLTADADGKVHVHNELSRDLKIGAGVGAIFGVLLTVFFPIFGLVAGAGGGALFGALLHRGVDQKFVDDVKAQMKPNTSAIFLVVERADMNALRAALAPFHGTLMQTTLDDEIADQIRGANKSAPASAPAVESKPETKSE